MMLTIKANGAEIPAIGLGTWQLRGDAARRAVHLALECGYRHIDTAAMYGNEAEIGEAIRTHTALRQDIFITTKVWPSDVTAKRLQKSAEASLGRLKLDQVDLLLIHWPNPDVPLAEQIRALCEAKKRGLARHIGVSNFPPRFIEAAIHHADEPLVTNQVEHHPYLDQSALFAACRRHGISITSYSPLGRGRLLDEPVVVEIARTKEKTPAQIVLRWHIEQAMNIAIPKSSNPQRIAENIDIFDFALTRAEVARISALRQPGGRIVGSAVPLDWEGSPR